MNPKSKTLRGQAFLSGITIVLIVIFTMMIILDITAAVVAMAYLYVIYQVLLLGIATFGFVCLKLILSNKIDPPDNFNDKYEFLDHLAWVIKKDMDSFGLVFPAIKLGLGLLALWFGYTTIGAVIAGLVIVELLSTQFFLRSAYKYVHSENRNY